MVMFGLVVRGAECADVPDDELGVGPESELDARAAQADFGQPVAERLCVEPRLGRPAWSGSRPTHATP